MRLKYLIFFLLLNTIVFSQDYIPYSQHINLQGLINPAYNGSRESYSALAVNRTQWEGAATTYAFNVHAPLPVEGLGAGLIFVQDEYGLYSNIKAAAAISFRLSISDNLTLATGMQFGLARQQTGVPDVADPSDNLIGEFGQTVNRLSTGFGFYLYSSDYFIGLSMPEILPQGVETQGSDFGAAPLMLYGGYLFDVGSNVKLKPTAFFEATTVSPIITEIGVYAYFADVISFGVATRAYPFSSMVFSTELQLFPDFYVGYSYDMYFGSEGGMNKGAHEISLRYDISTRDLLSSPTRSIRYF